MNEDTTNSDFNELVIRYLSGQSTDEEVDTIEQMVPEDETLAGQFRELRRVWQLSAADAGTFDRGSAWNQLLSKINTPKEETNSYPFNPNRQRFQKGLRIAATVVVLLGTAFLLYYMFGMGETTELMASDKILEETLIDGTEITLNTHSKLVYESNYNEKERRVRLIGSAFFDVVRNPSKPFFVETENMTVEVLGTSFLVNARPEAETIEVIVNSGFVTVSAFDGNTAELQMGEKIVLDKSTTQLNKMQNQDINFLSWKTKTLIFEDTPLPMVIEAIEQTYNVQVKLINPELRECSLTATYKEYPAEKVLELVAETLDLKVDGSGTQFELRGTGCAVDSE